MMKRRIINILILIVFFGLFLKLFYDSIETKKKLKLAIHSTETVEVQSLLDKFEFEQKQKELNAQYVILFKKFTLLEEAISPKNFRWVKIKKVRNAVQKTIEDFDLPKRMNTIELTQYAGAVVDWSEQYDVSIPLILAMSRKESAFNPIAKSHAGALGVIQIMPSTAKEIAADLGARHYSLYKIKDNVRFGIYYIMKMLDDFNGDANLAVRAYNCGPTCVRRVLAGEYNDYPAETKNYAKDILGDEGNSGFIRYYENMGL